MSDNSLRDEKDIQQLRSQNGSHSDSITRIDDRFEAKVDQIDFDSGDSEEKQFSQRFKVIKMLGSGSFGKVVQALQYDKNIEYAVKVIEKNGVSVDQMENLRKEAAILNSLQHKNIVQFQDVFESETRIFIVMELLSDGSLHQLMREHKKNSTWFSEKESITIIKSIMSAVAYIHSKGIIHRDIKPENILIGNKKDLNTIKIADFGLSAAFETITSISLTQKCGTLVYMAPEFFARQSYSKPIDIWSCAIILFQLLNKGKHPFYDSKVDSTSDIKKRIQNQLQLLFPPQFPEQLVFSKINEMAKSLLQKMTLLDPSTRYSAHQVLAHPWVTGKHDSEVPLTMNETLTIMFASQSLQRMNCALLFISILKKQACKDESKQSLVSEPYKQKLKQYCAKQKNEKLLSSKIDVISSNYLQSVINQHQANEKKEESQKEINESLENLSENKDNELFSPSNMSEKLSPTLLSAYSKQEKIVIQSFDWNSSFSPLTRKYYRRKLISQGINLKETQIVAPSNLTSNNNSTNLNDISRTKILSFHNFAPKINQVNNLDASKDIIHQDYNSPEKLPLQQEILKQSLQQQNCNNFPQSFLNKERLNQLAMKKEKNSTSLHKKSNLSIVDKLKQRESSLKFNHIISTVSSINHQDYLLSSKQSISPLKNESFIKEFSIHQDRDDEELSFDNLKGIQSTSASVTTSPCRYKYLNQSQDHSQQQQNSLNYSFLLSSSQQQTIQDNEESPKISPPLNSQFSINNSKIIHLQRAQQSPPKKQVQSGVLTSSQHTHGNRSGNTFIQKNPEYQSIQAPQNINNKHFSRQSLLKILPKEAISIVQKSFLPVQIPTFSIQTINCRQKRARTQEIPQDMKESQFIASIPKSTVFSIQSDEINYKKIEANIRAKKQGTLVCGTKIFIQQKQIPLKKNQVN